MQTKVCTNCHKEKSIEEFRRNTWTKLGLRSVCRDCDAAYNKQYKKDWYLKYKYSLRGTRLKKKYGVSLKDFADMEAKQSGVCAICGGSESRKSKTKTYTTALVVDHDHQTGKVRGLLCHKCNLKLGVLEDEDFNRKAKAYLKNSAQ